MVLVEIGDDLTCTLVVNVVTPEKLRALWV